MFCPRCGTNAATGAETCGRCGASLARPQSPVPEPPAVRAPTNRGERAQRAAGVVAQSLPKAAPRTRRPPAAPSPAGPSGWGQVPPPGYGAPPLPVPPGTPAPAGGPASGPAEPPEAAAAWPPPPAQWQETAPGRWAPPGQGPYRPPAGPPQAQPARPPAGGGWPPPASPNGPYGAPGGPPGAAPTEPPPAAPPGFGWPPSGPSAWGAGSRHAPPGPGWAPPGTDPTSRYPQWGARPRTGWSRPSGSWWDRLLGAPVSAGPYSGTTPPTYFWQALVCLFLFLPTGVAAVAYSLLVTRRAQLGDGAGSVRASQMARLWCLATVVLFAVVALVTAATGWNA